MAAPVKAVPEGFHTITPYVMIQGVAQVLDFLTRAFDAQVIRRQADATGVVRHADVRIGTSMVMLAEAVGGWKSMPASLYLYVPDVDATYRQAIQAGGTSMGEPKDQHYGDRMGGVKDPAGNFWWIASRKEDLSDEETPAPQR